MKEIGFFGGMWLGLKSIPKMIKVYFDSKQMKSKWKINPEEKLLNTSLTDLREKYNITVIN